MPLKRRHALGTRAHRLLQAVVQLACEAGVLDEHVRLAREQQAERVDVGGADAGGAPVEDRDLGVQQARVVLVDLDAGVEQPAIEAEHGVVQEEILHAALEQELYPDAPSACRVHPAAKWSIPVMPPTNATVPSRAASLRCILRSRPRRQRRRANSGRNTSRCAPAACSRSRNRREKSRAPKPSTSRCTFTPRAAARASASVTTSPVSSSA